MLLKIQMSVDQPEDCGRGLYSLNVMRTLVKFKIYFETAI